MKIINNVIRELFAENWKGSLANAGIEAQRAQLAKTLQNQVDGFWSGHTAYNIAVAGGFLIDSKRHVTKRLSLIGIAFMNDFYPT